MNNLNFKGCDSKIIEWNTEQVCKLIIDENELVPLELWNKCGSLNSLSGCMLNTETGNKEIVKFYMN